LERSIRVRDLNPRADGSRVCLDLPDLLPAFEPDAHGWIWALQRVPELAVEEGWDFNSAALEHDICANLRGLTMTFEDLHRFGRRVRQVIWGEFIAGERPSALPLSAATATNVGRDAVAGLSAVDSSCWLIGGPTHVIERIAARFVSVEELPVEEWIRDED
jgi:hypothetical protein